MSYRETGDELPFWITSLPSHQLLNLSAEVFEL